jgi:hypothetical protein
MSTHTEQFAALPEPIQRELLDVARIAAGMSAEEKEYARLLLGQVALDFAAAYDVMHPGEPAFELIAGCAHLVTLVDAASGAAASRLVV